jgi:hypothetical protein
MLLEVLKYLYISYPEEWKLRSNPQVDVILINGMDYNSDTGITRSDMLCCWTSKQSKILTSGE